MNNTRTLKQFGFYTSLVLSILTIITFGIAFASPPISGFFCQADCIEYPYLDIISRFPRDYYWMFPAIVLTMVYLIFIVCIHNFAQNDKKLFSQIGFAFAIASSILLIMNYFIQLTIIQSSLLNGETEGIALWTQYNPNGLFIALEEIGYLFMSFSFLFIAFVFSKQNKIEKAIRLILIIAFILSIGSLIFVSFKYGHQKEYMYEVIVISINWFTFIIVGFLSARVFKRTSGAL